MRKEVLNSSKNMGNFQERFNGNLFGENGNHVRKHSLNKQSNIKMSLSWLDLKVFYIRISKCTAMDESIPDYLTVNNVPLDCNTLLEVNGTRSSICSDGISTILRRQRFDKKSDEVIYVSTDNIRMTGDVKFDVLDRDTFILSGVFELCRSKDFPGKLRNHGRCWNINLETEILPGAAFLKANQSTSSESASMTIVPAISPAIEVYVAGCFVGSPIVLTKTLQFSHRRKQFRKGMLESIPENEATECSKYVSSDLDMQIVDYPNYKSVNESDENFYPGIEYLEDENGELSWFNAGVRVGVGIGLSICLGVGIGVGLLVKTYQGTTKNFKRRLF